MKIKKKTTKIDKIGAFCQNFLDDQNLSENFWTEGMQNSCKISQDKVMNKK